MAEALKRRIGLGLLTAYGVGVMVGAGIYVLVGAVAGQAGIYAPLAFLLAGLVAAPSALSYAELSTRVPEAAGEAAFIEKGLKLHGLSVLVGLGIVLAGVVSAAAVLRGGVGYLTSVLDVPSAVAILALGAVLVAVAALGVLESLALAALFTLVEVLGLGMVSWAGLVEGAASVDWQAGGVPQWSGIGAAVVLAFFAFIGFEDLVNMAEEVRQPERTMPRAILLSLAITTGLYALVTLAAVRATPLDMLGHSEQPLALVWETATGRGAAFLSLIAVAAAMNGVLAQIVMASRVLYGLGKRSARLEIFHHAHPRFGTPILATLLVGGFVMLGALVLPVIALAGLTSAVLLAVFVTVNAALIALKRTAPEAPFRVPDWVPWVGLVAALAALVAAIGELV